MSVPIVVQLPAPASERSNDTEAIPEPGSPAVAASATLPESTLPGSVSETVGAAVSIWIDCECTGSALPTRS